MTDLKTAVIFGAGFTLGSTILGIALTPLVTVANMKINEFILEKFVE
jgi:hypothetical protein